MVPTADEGWFSDLEGIFLCRCAGQYKAWPGEDLAFGTPPRGGARYRFTMPWVRKPSIPTPTSRLRVSSDIESPIKLYSPGWNPLQRHSAQGSLDT